MLFLGPVLSITYKQRVVFELVRVVPDSNAIRQISSERLAAILKFVCELASGIFSAFKVGPGFSTAFLYKYLTSIYGKLYIFRVIFHTRNAVPSFWPCSVWAVIGQSTCLRTCSRVWSMRGAQESTPSCRVVVPRVCLSLCAMWRQLSRTLWNRQKLLSKGIFNLPSYWLFSRSKCK